MQIHGFQLEQVGSPLVLSSREEPSPGPGQALIEVVACGVCHTDLGFVYDGVPTRHALPLVLGHEVAGNVLEIGAGVDERWRGARVVVPAVIPCGRCTLCQQGLGEICRAQVFPGNDVHGGFASHLVVPAHGLARVSDALSLSDHQALSVCADAVSTAYQAVTKSRVGSGDFALFIGVGGVGGFGVQLAHALGARVLALDISEARLESLKAFGADFTLNVKGMPVREVKRQVRELAKVQKLPAAGWKIFETSGTAPGQELAFQLLTFGATLGVVGYHPGDVTVRISNLMAFSARAIGTWGCLPALFPEVLAMVETGAVALEPFIERHPLSTLPQVFEALHAHALSRRPVLIPDFPS